MRFEARLPAGIDTWALRAAGLEAHALSELSTARFEKKKAPSFPATIRCRYLHSDKPIEATVTVFGFGERERIDRWLDKDGKIVIQRGKRPQSATHLGIEIGDDLIGKAIQQKLDRYSLENDGEGAWWREHCALYDQIDQILKRDGLSNQMLQQGKGQLTRRAIESLMQLCAQIDPLKQGDIHHLFGGNWVPKEERGLVAAWLLKRFEADPETDDQLGMRIWDNAVPEIAEDLIRLIENRRYDHHRGPLCQALAKTKHPRAADVIASVLNENWMALWCLSALGKVRNAESHIPKIRPFLRHPEGDVRREAKRLLKKLGVPVETPPAPVHLVRNSRSIPKHLEEWSSNLDMDDLLPTLKKASQCVDQGFGEIEIAEIMGVAEGMQPEQTRAFRFEVSAGARKTDLWIVIFMDDIESPDLAVYASDNLIQKLNQLAGETNSER